MALRDSIDLSLRRTAIPISVSIDLCPRAPIPGLRADRPSGCIAILAAGFMLLSLVGAARAAATQNPVATAAAQLIEVHRGQFQSAGKPVEDFYCEPAASGAHPAVILLHGAVPRGWGDEAFVEMCRGLAAAGYYAMFVEYYSQAGPARPGDRPTTGRGFAAWVERNNPVWTREIADASHCSDNRSADSWPYRSAPPRAAGWPRSSSTTEGSSAARPRWRPIWRRP